MKADRGCLSQPLILTFKAVILKRGLFPGTSAISTLSKEHGERSLYILSNLFLSNPIRFKFLYAYALEKVPDELYFYFTF